MKPVLPSARERHDRNDTRAQAPETVRVWLLGGFRVWVGSRTAAESGWRLRKAKSLIKLLALSPGHKLHREIAMDLLWPDLGMRAAANNLRGALHAARRVLEPTTATSSRHLCLVGEELVLCPGSRLWVDVDAFEEAAQTARRSAETAAYRAAIELYAGELLPEDRYEEWAESRRNELRETYLALLSELALLCEERSKYVEAIEALRRLLSEDPVREEAHAHLMRLYALSDQRAEALRQYELLDQVLRRELGVEPDAKSRHLYEDILSRRFPTANPSPGGRPPEENPGVGLHNLPSARDVFVGREREMVELKRLLSMTSLLTLTGTGGSGKTRLALEMARDLSATYPDGVWLVELAGLSGGELVPQAVASALGVREQPGRPPTETLLEHLRDKRALLILDNCEHLLNAVTRLSDTLLTSCPRLRILATSREPLGAVGEVSWRVPPLSVPGADRPPAAEDLVRYESVRLFVDRARQRVPAFELTPANAGALVEVCRKLDGIPLAIELAAARMDVLAAEQIAERMDRALALLTGGSRVTDHRHHTLRGTLDWSYELLGELERKLFGRLSVFAGGFTLEAAEAVGSGDGIEVSDVLESFLMLVDKSLVVAEPSGSDGFRYGMLEPVRQYAREKLEQSGEARLVWERHALYYLALAEGAEPELTGPDQAAWLKLLEREHDNLRTARRWLRVSGWWDAGLRLAGALWRFWYTRGHLEEGQEWLDEVLLSGDDTPSSARSKVLNGAGALAFQRGDLEKARRCFEQSLAVDQALDDKPGMARALNNLATMASHQGDYARATELLERSLEIDRSLDNTSGIAYSLGSLGDLAFFQDEFEQARGLYEQSLALHQRRGDKRSVALTLNNLGDVARRMNDPSRAVELYKQSLREIREVDDEWLTTGILIEVGCLLAAQNRAEQATRVLGAADRSRSEVGFELAPHKVKEYERALELSRSELGERAFEAAWNSGRAMPLEGAVQHVLLDEGSKKRPDSVLERSPSPKLTGLTRRERELASLIAQGLTTNRQISEELFISERTVETHVRNILKKLRLGSRAQLAALAIERPLDEAS